MALIDALRTLAYLSGLLRGLHLFLHGFTQCRIDEFLVSRPSGMLFEPSHNIWAKFNIDALFFARFFLNSGLQFLAENLLQTNLFAANAKTSLSPQTVRDAHPTKLRNHATSAKGGNPCPPHMPHFFSAFSGFSESGSSLGSLSSASGWSKVSSFLCSRFSNSNPCPSETVLLPWSSTRINV